MTVNKILKNSSLYTFCALLQKGTGFLLLPIYTTYLKPEDYGIMNLITSITGFLSILFLVSLHAAAARFHFKYVTSKGQAIVWGTILLMVLFNSAFWGLICIIFHDALLVPLAEGIPFYPLLLLAILGTMLSPLYLFYQQWLQCTQDGLRYTLNLMCNFLLQVFLNLLMLMVFHQGVLGIIISSFIVSMIFFIYSMISFLPHITLCINKEISVAAFKYSLPLIPHSVSGYLSVMLDRILLNKLIGIQQVGLYGVANQFGNILNLFTSSINQAFTPWLYQKLEKENESSNYKSIYKFAEISNVLCCFVALVITFFSPEFIRLMTTDEFYSSWQPIVFITFGYVLNGLYFFFSKSLFFSYTKYVMIISLSTVLLNFVFNMILIPNYGYLGAGVAFLLSQFVSSVIKGAQSCRNYAINFVNGTYLIYLDADDLIASYCFEQRVDYLENHPELDFAVFPMIGFKKQLMDVDTILYGYRENGNDISNLVRRTLPFVVVTNIYRLDFIRENSIEWDIKLKSFQDSDFNLSVIAVGGKYCYSNLKPDYYYRISGNEHSISKKIITSVHVDSHIYFFEKQFNRLHNGNLYENDFLVFSDLLFKIFSFNMNYSNIKKLLSCSFYLKHPFVRFKLVLIAWIKNKMNISNKLFINLSLMLLCPIYELRFRLVYIKWYRYQYKSCRTLIDKMCNEKNN